VTQITQGEELEKGFTPEMAQAESERCLQCGLICYLREKEKTLRGQKVAANA
jgi:NADPH-dependent glutamate synthase beta subunit-like oxidoreductase